jgi:protein-S-isoprenylcysteine O-methyltransferase Ste14
MSQKDLILVIIQVALLLLFIIIPVGYAPPMIPAFLCFFMTTTGILIASAGVLTIGKGFTPFPTPKASGQLKQTGIYKYIRHPMYSGIIIAGLGIAFYNSNIPRLIICLILWIFFEYKSRYEEKLLEQKYPEYSQYKAGTGRFFPSVNILKKVH